MSSNQSPLEEEQQQHLTPKPIDPAQMDLWVNARSPPIDGWEAVQKFDPGSDSSTELVSGQLRIGDQRTRRLLIVGDVHGHLPELKRLLDKIGFDREAGDHVILVGDLVNKGPDSAGVVQFAMDMGAHAVKGNNEDRILLAVEALRSGKVQREKAREEERQETSSSNNETEGNSNAAVPSDRNEVLPNLLKTDFDTVASLTDSQIAWLSSLPAILDMGLFTNATKPPWNAGTIVVAHAGLIPDVPLAEQDPWAVANMRSLVYPPHDLEKEVLREAVMKAARKRVKGQPPNWPVTDEEMDEELKRLAAEGHSLKASETSASQRRMTIPIEGSDGDLWRDAWNRKQNLLQTASERMVVVYGHDAKAGVQVEPEVDIREGGDDAKVVRGVRYAFGLDSGCVYGRHLTALVIEARPEDGSVVHRIEQVEHDKE
ncbi:calcineurin-like phosphoesterase [Thelonectria olida]|uniref:Calcineurin-like phosphoesterase n=1 Tax=Thelonectria olida TaxID=1576542 RepID=A0A9P8WIY6_9HYPO|nr:calcineurin-like phosphoesterase [Thelonectria olida]